MVADPAAARVAPVRSMQQVLEARRLTKRYGDLTAVDDVSFSVRGGVCFGLLGPNGAGKTTTIEIMEGVLEPTSGQVLYEGEPIGARFRQEVGILFQRNALPERLTVRQSVAMFRGLYERGLGVDEVIRLCALEPLQDREATKLSGGQLQRLLLAIALVNDPRVLFLDEPTTGLDPQARRAFWELVQAIKARNKAIILTTHYMDEAQLLCDEVAIMDRGRIIAQDTPQRLLRQHFAEVLLELPRHSFTATARSLPLQVVERNETVEIVSDDLDSTLRRLLDAHVPLNELRIRSPNLEDLFLKLTGKELRA